MPDLQPQTVAEPAATQTFSTQTEKRALPADLVILPEVPGYTIVRMIGRGGMGIVYEARDQRLLRTVALKMILMGPHASEKDKKRFRQEAEAVAQLQHPGIVQIYEIGESPTGPFLALEYVGGGSLAEKLDGKPWLPIAAAELVEHITRAVEAAHQAGIIHRDLKPANILLNAEVGTRSAELGTIETNQSGSDDTSVRNPSSALRVPKITDFGLAKRLDSAQGQTASGAIMGTPSYMAPEQAEGRSSTIGPATDVYALGAILYELLTGRPPFVAETAFDTIMQVAKQDAVPPSRLNPKVPADLETICLKCLRKEKDRRYLSATALAEDLRCFREGRPISARPVNAVERGWRWCRRNPVVAGLLTAVGLLLIAGTAVATYFAVQANQQWKDAQTQGELAKRNAENAQKNADEALNAHREADRLLYAARINLAQNALRENRLTRLRELLQETTPAEGADDYRGWEWHYLQRQANMEKTKRVWGEGYFILPGTVSIAPDAKRCAAVFVNPRPDAVPPAILAVHEIHTGRRIFETPIVSLQAGSAVALSSDGLLLAESLSGQIRVWEMATQKAKYEIPVAKGGHVSALAFDQSANRLAIASGSLIKIVNPFSGKPERTIPVGSGAFVYHMVFDDKNARLFFGLTIPDGPAFDSEVLFADLTDGKITSITGRMPREPVAPFAVDRGSPSVAVAQGKKRVLVWDQRNKKTPHTVPVLSESIASIAFVGPQTFAVGGASGLVSVYSTNSAAELSVLRSHANPVVGLASLGNKYFSVDVSGEACEWDPYRIERQRLRGPIMESFGMTARPTFSPSGRILACVGGDLTRTVNVWDLGDLKLRSRSNQAIGRGGFGSGVGLTAVSRDERMAAAVLIRQENDDLFGNAAGLMPGLARIGGPNPFPRALLDVGARVLAPDTEIVRLIDLVDKNQFPAIKLPEIIHQMLLSGDGRHLFTAGAGWRIHETTNGKPIAGDEKRNGCLAIATPHPDGRQLAVAMSREHAKKAKPTAQRRATIVIRSFGEADEVTLPLTAIEATCTISQMQFSRTGKYLAAVAFDNGELRYRDGGTTFRLLLWKRDETDGYRRVAVPREGRFAAILTETVGLAFDETGEQACCAVRTRKESAEVRVWKLDSDRFQNSFRVPAGMIEFAGFTDDGRRLLVASGTAGDSESHTAELRVFDLVANQELLEITLGQVIGAQIGVPAAYHFDGQSLRVAAWNEKGAELRIVDGSPTK